MGVSSSLRPPCSFGGPSLSLDATDRSTNLRPCLGRSPVRVDCHLARSAMVSGVWVFVGKIEPGQNIRRSLTRNSTVYFARINILAANTQRCEPALFFPRFGLPHILHSAHGHGCVHIDGAPHLPQHILDRLQSRGASRGDPGHAPRRFEGALWASSSLGRPFFCVFVLGPVAVTFPVPY